MNRAIVTFATGAYEELLEVSLPAMRRYAVQHGYTVIADPPPRHSRPPSWMKIPLLHDLLDEYDELLWLDSDVIIVDTSHDLADDVPPWAWQALVRHHTPDGEVPNCGVWFVKPEMGETLDRLWEMDRYLDHPWWEQGALLELLGYQGRPARLADPTGLYDHTYWLDLEWNSHEERDRHPQPRFAHATCGPLGWRLAVMHRYANDRQPAGEGAVR